MTQDSDGAVTTQSENLNGKGLQDRTMVEHTNVLPPRLLDYQSASHYLSLSYWSVRTLVTNGEVPHVRFGKRILIDREDLDIWIDQHKEVGV